MTDRRGLDVLRRWARIFDSAIRIPGTNITFGIDPLLGLIPGIGDLASPILSIFMIWHGAQLRVPRVVLARMLLNALIDAVVGLIPVAGDLFDFGWKATEWNLALLEKHAMPGQRATRGDWLFVVGCCVVLAVVAVLPLLLLVWLGASV
ncbi:MAG: DUF4112 domain-containing protein, partial [Actinomycetes bacterium]